MKIGRWFFMIGFELIGMAIISYLQMDRLEEAFSVVGIIVVSIGFLFATDDSI